MKFGNFDNIDSVSYGDGKMRQVFYGENSMLVMNTLEKNTLIDTHMHPHEQITFVYDGKCEITIDGEKRTFVKGDMILTPSNAPHSLLALEKSSILDVFSPIRKDFI